MFVKFLECLFLGLSVVTVKTNMFSGNGKTFIRFFATETNFNSVALFFFNWLLHFKPYFATPNQNPPNV